MRYSWFLIVLAAACTPAHAGWFGYDSYEDCMLGRMKGQSQMMYSTADKACKKQFGVEFSVGTYSTKWKFDSEPGVGGIIRTLETDPEYDITKGTFKLSKKECAEAKDADFSETIELTFKNGIAPLPLEKALATSCGRAVEFKAKYK